MGFFISLQIERIQEYASPRLTEGRKTAAADVWSMAVVCMSLTPL